MRVLILCGGRGTRLQEKTHVVPKALVKIGHEPILWHLVHIYIAQGFRRFTLLTGYLHEEIDLYLSEAEWPPGVVVDAVDTGLDTPTGGRVHAVADSLRDGGTFCLTYGDGVADIDLGALVDLHRSSGSAATMTVVRPYCQWGVALLEDDGRVLGFQEKPQLDHWINGGFFCVEPEVLDYLDASSVFEQAPLEGLAADGKLSAYRHPGFWECMDTFKDSIELNELWATGRAPWAPKPGEVPAAG
jgi:glucose-1-phosphate cytidylyltransferase